MPASISDFWGNAERIICEPKNDPRTFEMSYKKYETT